jgi:putative nucleotidyltransferase with HDIG domain
VSDSFETQSIQEQLLEITTLLSRVMMQVARSSDGQTSLILRDLAQVASSLNNIKAAISSQMQASQRQVGALADIGSVINSSLGVKRVLSEVMDRLIALMGAERGFLMLRESSGELNVQIARGLDPVEFNQQGFSISKTIAHRVAESGEIVLTTNAQEDPRFDQQHSIATYHLLSILCAPLKIKDELIGVIYVDNRIRSGTFQQSDLQLITAFANQAAVAIDNARLFDDLQESNAELEIAYQATLEGWVRALDLRDKETEGHTQRVTALTVRLAQSLGVDDEGLLHIRRGALLHDIGKMAIPDGILLKPGDLTPEERTMIQLHPVYAHEMLSPIKFLIPALDIPYCHHEKWDGSGYPRGLKGEEIPLAARIFTVVDVWDALVSDRPYRRGLQPTDIRKYITEQSGVSFDPRIAVAFLDLKDLSV